MQNSGNEIQDPRSIAAPIDHLFMMEGFSSPVAIHSVPDRGYQDEPRILPYPVNETQWNPGFV